ncbi:MAG TPA: TetR/AcrR family transcriptional regulator [Acidimicrobiales bacterium]|nr:TetR/AcrR family transcriptional regulator [Acidimicrobiales bacterium]
MGRPPKFDQEKILDVTARIVAEEGPGQATVATIAKRLGAPSGSIYHRFESKDLLLARLWLRTVRRAQEGFLAALAIEDVDRAAREAALHIPRWSRQHLPEATVLLLYRREDLADHWPAELGDEISELNQGLEQAVRDFTKRRFGRVTPGRLQRVAFALIDVPYGGSRRYLLAGRPPPLSLDDLVLRACDCTLLTESGST